MRVVVVVVVSMGMLLSMIVTGMAMCGRDGRRGRRWRELGGMTAACTTGRGGGLGRGGAVIVFLMGHGVNWIVCSRSKVKRLS
ncbi:hypothetical protein [Mitsuaria sp. 7]|uniref:hypothetical protein n=1 Tax=Mitsuaria sp. 7 TaxID=1658665 RepID=UPI0007DD99F0|nr:hypothetical protein [Mitsuaria sp. 7]ANH69814.1 hypothetical protein ABE85_23540 [Mitsuaria sp. 7]